MLGRVMMVIGVELLLVWILCRTTSFLMVSVCLVYGVENSISSSGYLKSMYCMRSVCLSGSRGN